eukprot:7837847-Pyramimonas_sp.AAC.1
MGKAPGASLQQMPGLIERRHSVRSPKDSQHGACLKTSELPSDRAKFTSRDLRPDPASRRGSCLAGRPSRRAQRPTPSLGDAPPPRTARAATPASPPWRTSRGLQRPHRGSLSAPCDTGWPR